MCPEGDPGGRASVPVTFWGCGAAVWNLYYDTDVEIGEIVAGGYKLAQY